MEDNESEFENSMDSENKDIDEEAEKLELSKDFQECVIKYVKLDDIIRKKQSDIKEVKKLRKPCEEFMLSYLEDIKKNEIQISDGMIKKKHTETKTPITNKVIKNALEKKINNPGVVQEVMKLVDEREKKKKVKIHRVIKKNSLGM